MIQSQRLRQLASLTGLDGFADELRAMADEIESQAVPMTLASRDEIMATRTADVDADEWPEPWSYQRGWNDAESHYGITQHADCGEG
jgi:hypothetical protein